MSSTTASTPARLIATVLAAATLGTPLLGHADSINLGASYILSNDHNTDLTQTAPAPINAGGNGSTLTPSGLNYHNQPSKTLLLTYSLELTDHVSVEAIGGIPPKFSAKGVRNPGTLPDGRAYAGETLLKGTAIPVITFVEYQFRDPGEIRPYGGVGFWYTRFVHSSTTDAGNNVSGGQTHVDLSSTHGVAFLLGASVPLYAGASLALSYSRPLKLQTHIRTVTQGGVVRESDADLGLSMYSVCYRLDI